MAKPIFAPRDEAARILEALKEQLFNSKCFEDINIKTNFKGDDRRAVLYFTQTAWVKMTELVVRYKTEVQWHGLVKRLSENEFEIYDILVPPHTVTAATVTSDPEKYTNWINSLEDNEFNDLRFHGHSHVNMQVSPSPTDKDYRKDVVTQLPKPDENNDVFYIFLIINKDHEWSAEIYDLTHNSLYSTASKEIDMYTFLDGGHSIDEFIAEAKAVAVQAYTTAYKGSNYGGYQCYQNQTPQTPKSSAGQPVATGGTGYTKKNDVKSTKKDDDRYGVDEDPDDPFYCRENWWR